MPRGTISAATQFNPELAESLPKPITRLADLAPRNGNKLNWRDTCSFVSVVDECAERKITSFRKKQSLLICLSQWLLTSRRRFVVVIVVTAASNVDDDDDDVDDLFFFLFTQGRSALK